MAATPTKSAAKPSVIRNALGSMEAPVKPDYIDAGYQDAIKFNPNSGIIQYGTYEFRADQVGLKPNIKTYTYDDYLAEQAKPSDRFGFAASKLYGEPKTEAELRAGFIETANAMAKGREGGMTPNSSVNIGQSMSGAIMSGTDNSMGTIGYKKPVPASYATAIQIDDNTFEIARYNIPTDIEFINKLNASASNLSANAAMGQVTDSSRPVGRTARLGKPNYSRAASILAGQQSPLGGASTTLGS